MAFSEHKKIANFAHPDTYITQIYQGVPCFINIIWFLVKTVNVISLTLVGKKHGLSWAAFHETLNGSAALFAHLPHRIYLHRSINEENAQVKRGYNCAPIFMKRSNTQQHYLHISCTEFHTNRPINVEECASIAWL